jgi:DNA topoisomerase-1
MSHLIIVESPGKIAKIKSLLGAQYSVVASVGHVMGMDPKKLGFDIDNQYMPEYIIMPDKKDIVAKLRTAVAKAARIYLCADADREGEMIAYNLLTLLGLSTTETNRATFTEITKTAITAALSAPRTIDMNLVHAQQARAVLDKLIGYKVSPVLWRQFHNYKLSAGRVQSIVTKLIVERETAIAAFNKSCCYPLFGSFESDERRSSNHGGGNVTPSSSTTFTISSAECTTVFSNKDTVHAAMEQQCVQMYTITDAVESTAIERPSPPFITSSLQQEASYKLGMSPTVCMRTAQALYEAGFITYMRTDSRILSGEIHSEIRNYVSATYGVEHYNYVQYGGGSSAAVIAGGHGGAKSPPVIGGFGGAKSPPVAQEAHEACRPTHIATMSAHGDKLTGQHDRLYKLIWLRTVASQMKPATFKVLQIHIANCVNDVATGTLITKKGRKPKLKQSTIELGVDVAVATAESICPEYKYIAKYRKIVYAGFLMLYPRSGGSAVQIADSDEAEDEQQSGGMGERCSPPQKYPAMDVSEMRGMRLVCTALNAREKWNKPPHGRYNEANLIKKLEELGIGRPATYASMVSKVQTRQYVELKTVEPRIVIGYALEWQRNSSSIGLSVKEIEIKVDGDKNKLFPTSLGVMISQFLDKQFEMFMDYKFTANIEELLDKVAAGQYIWWKVVDAVYQIINPTILTLKTSAAAPSAAVYKSLGIPANGGEAINIVTTARGYAVSQAITSAVDSAPVIPTALTAKGKPRKRVAAVSKIKYKYASVAVDEIDTITLDAAAALLSYPRRIGEYEGCEIVLARAHNVYLKYNGANYSIDKYIAAMKSDIPPNRTRGQGGIAEQMPAIPPNLLGITEADAIRVLQYYIGAAAAQTASEVEIGEYKVKKGPYGYYIKYNKTNYALPKKYKQDVMGLTVDECKKVIDKKNSTVGQQQVKRKWRPRKK